MLTHDLHAARSRAELAGTRLVLDAPLPTRAKLPLALDLARSVRSAPRGRLPDLDGPFERARQTSALRELHHSLDATIRGVVTRSFRGAFGLAALLALLSLAPLALLRREPA